MSVVEFRNGYGRSFWQPERSDGHRLFRVYWPSWATTEWGHPDWSPSMYGRSPRLYRLRRYAEWRARRGDAALRRSQLREVTPTRSDGAADTGPAV